MRFIIQQKRCDLGGTITPRGRGVPLPRQRVQTLCPGPVVPLSRKIPVPASDQAPSTHSIEGGDHRGIRAGYIELKPSCEVEWFW
jgi:hypothetical protein